MAETYDIQRVSMFKIVYVICRDDVKKQMVKTKKFYNIFVLQSNVEYWEEKGYRVSHTLIE